MTVRNIFIDAARVMMAAGALVMAFLIGYQISGAITRLEYDSRGPDVNTGMIPAVEARLVERYSVKYVEKPVTEIKYVDKAETSPLQPASFTDIDELRGWIKGISTETLVFFETPGTQADCDDYATALQQRALKDGYLISMEIIYPDEYNETFKASRIPEGTVHAIDMAIVGNKAYYIEPQTGEIAFAAYLD